MALTPSRAPPTRRSRGCPAESTWAGTRVATCAYACAMTVVTHDRGLTASVVRDRLAVHEEVVHATIEVHYCEG